MLSTAPRAVAVGLVLAVIAALALHRPLAAVSRVLLALVLAVIATVYPGALLAQSQPRTVAVAELVAGVLVFGCALVGVTASPLWLAVGYALHGGWDWLHHGAVVPTRVAPWFPPLCVAFDWAIAGYVLAVGA